MYHAQQLVSKIFARNLTILSVWIQKSVGSVFPPQVSCTTKLLSSKRNVGKSGNEPKTFLAVNSTCLFINRSHTQWLHPYVFLINNISRKCELRFTRKEKQGLLVAAVTCIPSGTQQLDYQTAQQRLLPQLTALPAPRAVLHFGTLSAMDPSTDIWQLKPLMMLMMFLVLVPCRLGDTWRFNVCFTL
jgi:hypothetical protein